MWINKLKRLFFLPEDFFRSFSDNKALIYIGILLVGIRDMGFNVFSDNRYIDYFRGKESGALAGNIMVAAAAAVLIGTVDVLFYCIPLSDLFKRFRKQKEPGDFAGLSVKLMKAYILANILVTPVDALTVYLAYNPNSLGSEAFTGFLLMVLGLISMLWFFSTIIRGANALYNILPPYRLLTIPAVILWMELLGAALDFIYRNWVVVFFR